MSNKLIIFDTTLRDGEQSPNASMIKDEKICIAKVLEKMRVDVIEAGFAIASPGDFKAVQAIANNIQDSTICSLARALDKDIDRAGEALRGANSSRIHTFIATSDIHMKMKLNMTPDQVVERAVYAVKRARNWTDNVEFSPEDAGRSDEDFLCRIIEAAIDAGATTINIPDTVGYNIPHQFGATIKSLIERVVNSDKAIFSAHCHNDLGLAVANSLSAVISGARQVECTINGLGERAGNTSLEELVMAVRTRQDIFDCDTGIDTTHILSASRLVSNVTGFIVQPNKAIVGANAFAHEAGIHQDGVLKHRETYEIMRAEDVGWGANSLVMGKHSGRNAFKVKMQELGIEFDSDDVLNTTFKSFKKLTDKKHEIFDEDLQALVKKSKNEEQENIQLVSLKVFSKTGKKNSAQVVLSINGKEVSATTHTSGTVDAIFSAINLLVDVDVNLQLYSVSNVTQGSNALGEVNVRLESDGCIVNGQGADTDIIIASAKAYLHGLNKILVAINRMAPISIHQLERVNYLEAFSVPTFLYTDPADTIAVCTQKISVQCLVIETQNKRSFCQTGKIQDFLFKMLGAIGLEKANVKCITIDAVDLEHTLGQYAAKTVLLMSKNLLSDTQTHFSMQHPSEISDNETLKREGWEVLKRLQQCLK